MFGSTIVINPFINRRIPNLPPGIRPPHFRPGDLPPGPVDSGAKLPDNSAWKPDIPPAVPAHDRDDSVPRDINGNLNIDGTMNLRPLLVYGGAAVVLYLMIKRMR